MKNDGLDKSGDTAVGSDHCIDFSKLEKKEGAEENSLSSVGQTSLEGKFPEHTVVINNGESGSNQFGESHESDTIPMMSGPELNSFKNTSTETPQKNGSVSSTKKAALSRSDSFQEQCRVCQQQAEEALIDLGCQCRGGLAKAHRSCIDTWFHTRGSNKCEICQQIAINVPPPESQPSRNYWVWRVDPSFRASGIAPERERLYSPLWVAFSILIGGLLLDVLISISLGVTALPVNIIIGVLVVLGLGTAFRLALECFHELSLRRTVQNMDRNAILGPPGYHSAV